MQKKLKTLFYRKFISECKKSFLLLIINHLTIFFKSKRPVDVVSWYIDRQKFSQVRQKLNVCDADRILHQSLVPPSTKIFGIPSRHSPKVFAVGSDGECAIDVNV